LYWGLYNLGVLSKALLRWSRYSFCPGEGWLAARYIFNDLEDMIAFPESAAETKTQEAVTSHAHYDASRQPHEFKGFFLPEA